MSFTRILVVDDEPQVHRFLKPALEAAGYCVERANSAAEGLRLAATHNPALILLDLGLPDMDGQDVLARIRATSRAPVIIVSARTSETEKIRALDGGADDYVEKPFASGELLARLRACLRRGLAQDGLVEGAWRWRGIEIDLLNRNVRVDRAPVTFTPREYDLLATLVRHAGQVLTHKRLLTAVWGQGHAEDLQYLRVYVGHLRRKLGPYGAGAIGTEGGVGYRMAEGEALAGPPNAPELRMNMLDHRV
jgi:two-component system KDP operon response regulator KdpE